tara:strand:+ start:1894 stop:3195 length:1302 start_codon:yes stop_codon:yes gene_type:complete
MQGFIETAFGLKPLNLTNIQNVTYVTNRDVPYFSNKVEGQGVKISSGSLIVEYIGNATGYRNSGGNIVIGLDHYNDEYYPIERFWAWVKDVSAGSVTKTFNQYLNNRPAYGISTFAVTDFSPVQAYGIKLTDDQTTEDACGLTFKFDDNALQGKGMFNYVTFVTDGQTTFPEIGTRVFLSSTQGYNPNNFDNSPEHGSMEPPAFEEVVPVKEFNEKNVNAAQAMATSPIVADGRYAWLDGTPENTVEQFPPGGGMATIVTNPQSGAIYEVVIKSGRIHEVIACPADFDAFNAVKDIPGKMYSRVYNTSFIENYQPGFEEALGMMEQTQSSNCPCWIFSEPQVNKVVGRNTPPDTLGQAGIAGSDIVCTKGQFGAFGLETAPNPWFDVTLGFTDIPPSTLQDQFLEEGGVVKQLVCPTVGQGLPVEEAEKVIES